MNLDDLKKSRPSLTAKSEKPARRGQGSISMAELRARFGLDPAPAPTPEQPPPPPPKPKTD